MDGQALDYESPARDNTYHSYNGRAAQVLGALQILLGLIFLALQTAIYVINQSPYSGLTGYIAAFWCILAGAFGIFSGKRKSRCSVIATMVLCIITALIVAGFIVEEGRLINGVLERSGGCGESGGCQISDSDRYAVHYMVITMFSLGIADFIIDVTAAALCCQVSCCATSK